MIAFLVRRVAWLMATLLVVYTVTFFLMRAVPGGAVLIGASAAA